MNNPIFKSVYTAADFNDDHVETIARVCHEFNRIYCQSIGDDTQKHWEEAADWQRESMIKGVKFRLANPEAPVSSQHEAWLKEKVDAGWVYGEKKDAEAKTHPCILPFDLLPEQQRHKDVLFLEIFEGMADTIWSINHSKNETA